MIGILLAAGRGTRLFKDTKTDFLLCKPLIRISGKPLIEYSIDLFKSVNVKNVTVVVGQNNTIKHELDSNHPDFDFKYSIQNEPLGVVNALYNGINSIKGEDVLLQLSDEIFINPDIEGFVDYFYDNNDDFLISYVTTDNPYKIKENYSIDSGSDKNVLYVEEKPQRVFNNKKGTGICIFSWDCIEYLAQIYDIVTNTPKELCDYINLLIKEGFSGKCFCIAEEEINVNTSEDLNYAKGVYEVGKDIK